MKDNKPKQIGITDVLDLLGSIVLTIIYAIAILAIIAGIATLF